MLAIPSPHPHWVSDDEEARRIADDVLSEGRTKPILAITSRDDTGRTELDPDIVAAIAGDALDIIVFGPNAADGANDAFNARLDAGGAESCDVYNGAARLYPVRMSGTSDAPLYYVDTQAHREHMLEDLAARLVADGLLRRKPAADVIRQAARRFDGHDRRASDVTRIGDGNPAHILRTMEQTRELTDLLMSDKRMMPVVVVAQSTDRGTPFVDADLISNALHGLALVVVLRTDEAVAEFKRRMPRTAWVFGDAGRVFPTGTGWNRPDTPPRLFLPNEHVSRMLLTNLMMKDALINVADTLRELSALR